MAEATTNTIAPMNVRLALVDELIRARCLVHAAHMASDAIPDELQRDALQDVLDVAEASLQEARRLGEALIEQDGAPRRRTSAAHRALAREGL